MGSEIGSFFASARSNSSLLRDAWRTIGKVNQSGSMFLVLIQMRQCFMRKLVCEGERRLERQSVDRTDRKIQENISCNEIKIESRTRSVLFRFEFGGSAVTTTRGRQGRQQGWNWVLATKLPAPIKRNVYRDCEGENEDKKESEKARKHKTRRGRGKSNGTRSNPDICERQRIKWNLIGLVAVASNFRWLI